LLCLLAVCVLGALAKLQLDGPALRLDIIRKINNNKDTTWTAGYNKRFAHMTMGQAKRLMGVRFGGPKLPVKKINVTAPIPDSFDARVQWGSICPSMSEIRDQAACGSCWAFGAVEAMTDRVCIATKGASKVHLSAGDMNSCCDSCGFGCDGGYPSAAWDYWVSSGLVSGGNYKGDGCLPYQLPNCDHHVNGSYPACGNEQPTPQCPNKCVDGKTNWKNDKHFGRTSYSIGSDVSQIQTEIMSNGPVEADFVVYEDFLTYRSGVYQYESGQMLGGHAIKILGWGTLSSTPYWIVANSWNEDWGDKGYFLMLRGANECGIEDDINAGLAKTSSSDVEEHMHRHR